MPELPKVEVCVSDFGKRADENRRRRAFFTNNASVRGIFWYFHHLQSRRPARLPDRLPIHVYGNGTYAP